MERLQPILKQKFWILLGVALIMSLTGWWLATSTMLLAITARKAAIAESFKKVPKGAPNETWVRDLDNLNGSQEKAIAMAKSALWKRQQQRMLTWQEGMDLSSGYWGKFQKKDLERIRLTYEDTVKSVWKKLIPFDPNDPDGNGIVFYPFVNMYTVLGQGPWKGVGLVDSNRAWEIKEDLWLLERLFETIADLNGGPETTQNDAAIHQIDRLELRGGGPKGAAAAGSSSSMSPRGFLNMGKDRDDDGESRGAAAAVKAAAPTAALQKQSAEFDPADEFGNDGSNNAATYRPTATVTGATPGQPLVERYVMKEENLPYKTRGFYLSVKMDHRKIPAFIAELTARENTILPIEIIRVQMSRLHDDETSRSNPGVNVPMAMADGDGGGGGGIPLMRGAPVNAGRDDERDDKGKRRGIGNPRFNFQGGGGNAAAGNSGVVNANGGIMDPERAQAKATLDKVLSDPSMAQVSICGVFLLYKKVDDVAVPAAKSPATAAPPVSSEPPQTEAAGGKTETSTDTDGTVTAASTDEPAAEVAGDPANEPGQAPDPADPKPDDSKPDEVKPGDGSKPAEVKKPDDEAK